ncbi:RagB/SusD family nutrient uptake outer membrane protein [Dysgonomonas sp. Marseille-P4677]|uniref:RagB/SusD family nutrient uptake outer membrane protein n=1 Tax=Dysgonomonas sp. Marseille-P4677 TaxID=2364790 RepID=UPI001912854C|nr:RagB/SusD family nutrient uptake outer membrane protein [Dysgonomonas sp. Marseille-P4677]MBK5719835.1 RagB/SusD family nutrient uptake outer membrane protein [Dysgonomonas sp. Marseille-P4677]
MKNLLYILTIFVFFSCSDSFLDRYPEGWLHDKNTDIGVTGTDLLARGELQKAYDGLRAYSFCWAGLAMHNYTTPDAEKGSNPSDGANIVPFSTMSFTTDNSALKDYYQGTFNVISNANRAISLATAIPDSLENVKNSIVAEALVLRGAMYFRLTQAFGAVPYVDRVFSPGEESPERMSVPEIKVKAKEDIDWAIPYLMTRKEMVSTKNFGRVTQNTARAILAKMALYEKNWSEVITYTGEIIASGDNDLSTPYDKIFIEAQEFGPESIFEVDVEHQPNSKINRTSQYAQIQGVRGTPNLGWGFNSPSTVLIAAYEPGDPRKEATVLTDGQILNGETIQASGDSYNKFFNKKVYTLPSERSAYGRESGNQGTWVNIRLIRYSDIVLMHAEAANELGNVDDALAKLEMVRERARGGDNTVLPKVTDRNENILRDKIRHERRIELAMEFERFFDLVRWDLAKDLIPNFVVGKHELYPIPQVEIDNSNGILTQNPGY